ncbi:putative enoyl hydratase [Phaeomoniella chlamydospora]|uniref:Putative enoyl hydratase n=1 Tax=Phaeomoniella chlamydospora TaxID=158046 RepID=A0A0G2GW66_PHACM|nr:putative enoyl hydratase [Phaeomoniella chlamydospora]
MAVDAKTSVPKSDTLIFSFPTPQILVIILNRPTSLNAIGTAGHWELHNTLEWYDSQPSLRCAIITGRGRAFCAGQDLKEWNTRNAESTNPDRSSGIFPPSGFAGVSRRTGKKPIILAVNGIAFGGGMEMVANADIAVAGSRARFSLPEVKRGVVAIAGALPRLVRSVGRARAMDLSLTGRVLTALEAERWGIVSQIVDDHDENEKDDPVAITDHKDIEKIVLKRKLTQKALEIANEVAGNSPDSIIITKAGIGMGWEGIGAEEGSRLLVEQWGRKLNEGENLREGVRAFVEKRVPRWRDSKL